MESKHTVIYTSTHTHTFGHLSGSSSLTTVPADTDNSCPVVPWTSAHSLTTEPSSNQAKSTVSLGPNKESLIVGSIDISVIIVSIFKCRDQKISVGSIYNHGMSYRQLLRDSEFQQAFTSEQEWTTQRPMGLTEY